MMDKNGNDYTLSKSSNMFFKYVSLFLEKGLIGDKTRFKAPFLFFIKTAYCQLSVLSVLVFAAPRLPL